MTHATSGAGPLVSVAIPTYRGADYVAQAITSVLRQDLTDFELLVVDNDSRDGTQAIVESISDPRIRFVQNERNVGAKENWNRCLDLARGRYFKLLPHDDLIRTDCLSRQVFLLEGDIAEQIVMVFSRRRIIAPDGRELTTRGYPGGRPGRVGASALVGACVRYGTNLVGEPGGVLFRRSAALLAGRFDATHPYAIDLDYWFRLLELGDAWYLDEPLASFRVSPSQWSVSVGSRQSTDFRNFIAKAAAEKRFSISPTDRLIGKFTPALNRAARMLFYSAYVRS